MADNEVSIILRAVDKVSNVMSGISKSIQKVNDSPLGNITQQLTGFNLSSIGAAGAVTMVVKEIGKAITATSEYTTSIEDMSRLLGISAEDTSRLVQASDDLFISQDKLNTALLAASRQGIDVSINGLKGLSEQYLALNPGVDRAQFLMKTFGRSGADMGKLMEVGAHGIDKATEAIAGSLVVTDESIQKNIEYKQNLDELNDTFESLKLSVGGALIEALNDFVTGVEITTHYLQTGDFVLKEYTQDVSKLPPTLDLATVSQEELLKYMSWVSPTAESAASGIYTLAQSADILKTSLSGDLSKAIEDFNNASRKTTDEQIAAEDALKKTTEQLIYQKAAAYMDADAALELARQMGLVSGADYQAAKAVMDLTNKYDINRDGTIDATEATAGYNAEIMALYNNMANVIGLDGKTATIDVYGNYVMSGYSTSWNPDTGQDDVAGKPKTASNSNSSGKSYTDANGVYWQQVLNADGSEKGWTHHASGGDFMIPWSYGNEGFRLGNGDTASGGEHISITPDGKSSNTELLAELQALRNEMKSFARESGDAMGIKLMQLGVIR